MPSPCGLGVDLTGEVDLKRAINRDEAAEIAEHQRVMGIRRRADLKRRVAVDEAVEPRRSHQHRRHGDGGVDLLVPVVDDAGLHQVGDPVADRPRVDPETLLAAERAGHRQGNRAEAELDRRAVGDQAGDVIGDGAVDRPRRPPGSSIGGRAAGTSTSIAAGSIAVSPWVHGNSGLTCAITNRARPIAACRCSMPSPALYRPVSSGPLTCSSTRSIGRRPLDTRPLISEIFAGMTLSARPAKNRRPALAPPNAVTVTLGWPAAKASLKVSAKNTRNGGQRSAWASSKRVRNAGSAVASVHPIVSPARISRVKSSASGAIATGVFTRRSGRLSQKR